jgi:hypothetical protein
MKLLSGNHDGVALAFRANINISDGYLGKKAKSLLILHITNGCPGRSR